MDLTLSYYFTAMCNAKMSSVMVLFFIFGDLVIVDCYMGRPS